MNRVKKVNLYKNALIYNTNQEKYYIIKKYAEIEFFNGDVIKLNITANADITSCDFLKIRDKGKLIKTIFKNELA